MNMNAEQRTTNKSAHEPDFHRSSHIVHRYEAWVDSRAVIQRWPAHGVGVGVNL